MTFSDFLNDFASYFANPGLIAVGLALVGGVFASSVCPCSLPVGLGMTGVMASQEANKKKNGLFFAIFFFLGIVFGLSSLGAISGHLSTFLNESFARYWSFSMFAIATVGGVASFLDLKSSNPFLNQFKRKNLLGAFLFGLVFGIGTSAAPLLFLLSAASTLENFSYAVLLAFGFGVGRGLPFLFLGFFARGLRFFSWLSNYQKPLRYLSGLGLFLIAGYYLTVFETFIH